MISHIFIVVYLTEFTYHIVSIEDLLFKANSKLTGIT